MNNETAQATEQMNNATDATMAGSGIGQTTANIDLNAGKKDYTEEKTQEYKKIGEIMEEPEKQYTQGEHSQNLEKWQKEIDQLNEWLETPKGNGIFEWLRNANTEQQKTFKEYVENNPDNKDLSSVWQNSMSNYIASLKDNIYNTKNKSNYDNRTDEQIRADTDIQRKTEDARKAGINPAGLSYGGGGGGGGGSSSKDEEEERKRRKREKEEAERRRKEKQQENLMRTLQMLGGIGGRIGGYAMLGKVRNNNYNKPKQQQTNKPKWLDKYIDEIDNMKG